MKLHLRSFVFFIFSLISLQSFGQNRISGIIVSKEGKELSGATIKISENGTNKLIAYTTSNSVGEFFFRNKINQESVNLVVSYIGFKKWSEVIKSNTSSIRVVLEESLQALDEVLLEPKSIEKKGDTLNYSVSAFKDEDDRVIADVIRKLPGIEIKPNGEIFYQGNPIQKYYIDGLDLLEGRYNLANNNLSSNSVSKVQILENHQPIKVLDSLVISDRASLNIKLKKNVTVTGKGSASTGIPIPIWETTITPLLFSKNKQFLASYQSNNIGRDLSIELTDFSSEQNNNTFQLNRFNLLSIVNPTPPPFSKERWLDNNAHIGSVNSLFRLKKDFDFKINLSYFNDSQSFAGNSITTFLTGDESVTIAEELNSEAFKNNLEGKIIFEKNTNEQYFKNTIQFESTRENLRGTVARESLISQQVSSPYSKIENYLLTYLKIGNQLFSVNSYIGYNNTNQSLKITPNQFENINSDTNNASEFIIQNLKHSGYTTENFVGLKKTIKKIIVSSEIGFGIAQESLDSNIEDIGVSNQDFQNEIQFNKSKIVLRNIFSYKESKLEIEGSLPISLRFFKIQDQNANQDESNFVFEPTFFLRRKLSNYWNTSFRFNSETRFGELSQLYTAFIITDYRNTQRYNSKLPETRTNRFSTSLVFRNPKKGIFADFIYSLEFNKKNLLNSFDIQSNGLVINETIESDNVFATHNLNLSVSKRLKKLNTLLNLGTGVFFSKNPQIINSQITDIENTIFNLRLTIDSRINDWLNTSYNGAYNEFINQTESISSNNTITSQKHEFDSFFYLTKNQYLNLQSETYINKGLNSSSTNQFFNLKYQYTISKKRIDIFVKWQNILNEDSYINLNNSDFILNERSFNIRPAQLLLGTTLSF